MQPVISHRARCLMGGCSRSKFTPASCGKGTKTLEKELSAINLWWHRCSLSSLTKTCALTWKEQDERKGPLFVQFSFPSPCQTRKKGTGQFIIAVSWLLGQKSVQGGDSLERVGLYLWFLWIVWFQEDTSEKEEAATEYVLDMVLEEKHSSMG